MKKLLVSSALLAICSMSAMDKANFKFRFATAKDNLTPTMQTGLALYDGMVDKMQMPPEKKEQLKQLQSHVIGYVQAMANAGSPQWPLVLIEEEDGSPLGFSSLEEIESPENALAVHMTPVTKLSLYMDVALSLIGFIREQFPNKTTLVTEVSKEAFEHDSPLRRVIEKLGFTPCDDYTPNQQLLWGNLNDFTSMKKSLVEKQQEEQPKAE
jgi:hypothetical protein